MTISDYQAHRTQDPCGVPEFIDFGDGFSTFDFVESRFGARPSIHRCFSLARATNKCKTVVIEKIAPIGLIADENADFVANGYFTGADIYRISFFKSLCANVAELHGLDDTSLLGYVIVKLDGKDVAHAKWRVFEAVLEKYDHPHNCVANPGCYDVGVCGRRFEIEGVLYCQQNSLTNACAHVALRSLLSRIVPERDVAYSEMNAVAAPLADGGASAFFPGKGLSCPQIKSILMRYGVTFKDVDYCKAEKLDGFGGIREALPYQKIAYSGVESGYGALVGFNMPDPANPNKVARHIIPFYGHTFNKDTWVSDAETCYFDLGGAGYIPSECWTSSFIGHDDNFGCNFCIPRLYITPQKVDYVVELQKPGVTLSGTMAEAAAFSVLPELVKYIDSSNDWQKRFEIAFKSPIAKVILRSVCVSPDEYFKHLGEMRDWNGNVEHPVLATEFSRLAKWPANFWVVEVSLPQLFPANERKLGEIVLDASCPLDYSRLNYAMPALLFARLPGSYFVRNITPDGNVRFRMWNSNIKSHVAVLRCGCK